MRPRLPMTLVGTLWRWRGFLFAAVRRDFLSRYSGASLGVLWHLIQPLAQIAIYTLVLAEVMRTRLPGSQDAFAYSVFLCAGVLPWGLFAEAVTRGGGIFLEYGHLIKKSRLPLSLLPAIAGLNALINFAIVWTLFLLWLALSGRFPATLFAAVLPLLLLMLIGLALGLWLGIVNVFLRDVGQMVALLMQFWFWLTPVVWPIAAAPAQARQWLDLNPLAPLIEALQAALLGLPPPGHSLLAPALLALFLLGAALVYFRGLRQYLADEL